MILKLIEDIGGKLVFDKGRKTTWVSLFVKKSSDWDKQTAVDRVKLGLSLNYVHIDIHLCETLTTKPCSIFIDDYTQFHILENRIGIFDIPSRVASYQNMNAIRVIDRYRSMYNYESAKDFYAKRVTLVFEGHLDLTELTYMLDDFICEKVEDKSIDTLCFDDIQEFIKRHNKPFLRKLKNRKEIDV